MAVLRVAGVILAMAALAAWFVWMIELDREKADIEACRADHTFEQCMKWREEGRF